MKEKLKIIVDMDEVLVQFVQAVLDRWNKEFGTSYTRDQITGWSMEDILQPHKPGLIDEWCAEKGFFLDMEPMPDAIEGFNYLRAKGHDVCVGTSILKNAVNCFDDKRAWMKKYFPDWSMKNFFAISRKDWLDADMLIDDGGHNIRAWLEAGKTGALVFDAPWNREKDLMNSVMPHELDRVSGWKELMESMEEQDRISELLRKGADEVQRALLYRGGGFHPSRRPGYRRASETIIDAQAVHVGPPPDQFIKKD